MANEKCPEVYKSDAINVAAVKARDKVSSLRMDKEVFLKMLGSSAEIPVQIISTQANRLDKAFIELRDAKAQLSAGAIGADGV